MVERWKGWAIPGPKPQTLDSPLPEVSEDETLDALSGHYKIFQCKKGHRYSTDDLLVAWYGTTYGVSTSSILDLGTGTASVGMVAAWRLPNARVVGVEAQEISANLARKSIQYNRLETRFELRQGDFRDPALIPAEEKFDLILGSPPYFPLESGIKSEHSQKIACRFEVRGSIAYYARVASEHLNPGGVFVCVFPIQPSHQLERVLESAKAAGLSILRRRDVILKEGDEPLLGLFLMTRQSDLPDSFLNKTWHESPLVIRKKDGTIHEEYSVVKMSIGFPP